MENIEIVKAEAVEVDPTVETETEKPVKKTRKPRTTKATKPRTLEELKYADLKTMTQKEMIILIGAQAEELGFLRAQNEALKNNCEMAYEKVRLYEEDFKKMDVFYKNKLDFVNTQLNAFNKTIKLATTGGMN